MSRNFIAKLEGMKHIMRVETPRTKQWWLVIPARGDDDAVCVLIGKCKSWEHAANIEKRILAEYADRIVNA